jgi:uncharacterized alkaline shock family protein YloU
VAEKYGIEYIIDDGLLIRDNRILAGHSAKKEKTFMAAVKVALFDEKGQRDEVARKLQTEKTKKILILGTSEKMVNKIAARLQLPPISKIIKIEDIASQEEIERAIRTRKIEGKHVIPVPSIEIKRTYPNIFYDAIKIFKHRKAPSLGPGTQVHEKSVVRPEYSKRGKVAISESALSQMVIHCVDEYNQNIRIKKMVNKIATRLQLPAISKIIKIEDIATQEEIERAIRTRKIEGKHVIPVPSIEVKRNYPNIFYDAIRIFKHRKGGAPGTGVHEKSVVRPEYSKRGKVIISETALSQMVIHCVDEYNQNIRIKKMVVKDDDAGYRLAITIDVPYGTQLGGNIHELQQYIIDNIERYTGILIEEVNIIIDKFIQSGGA